jgi:hypothetical protein
MPGDRVYITITDILTDEQVKHFKMSINEDDHYINYKIDLSTLGDALLKELIEAFAIKASAIEGKQHITLTRSLEV